MQLIYTLPVIHDPKLFHNILMSATYWRPPLFPSADQVRRHQYGAGQEYSLQSAIYYAPGELGSRFSTRETRYGARRYLPDNVRTRETLEAAKRFRDTISFQLFLGCFRLTICSRLSVGTGKISRNGTGVLII